ncbi:sigma-54-dependent Fis family transcriptional regulator [uncultured Megasphaera sp.]|jgi:PAS domain S-box-containing protein|uniref:sigma-54 interaction domain-containing protein n=1 Tax=uncultured Megasphaera sp. TaxID=165188 RepID=UPI0025DA617D|nr:sigma 54-interacting transcriptional regulator [uncultured Megasphaera sp.]
MGINCSSIQDTQGKFLKKVLENLYGVVTVTDASGKILYLTKGVAQFWGYSQKDLIGKFIGDVVTSGDMDLSVCLEVIRRKKQVMLPTRNNDGTTYISIGNPVFDKSGRLEMVVCYGQKEYMIHDFLQTIEEERSNMLQAMAYNNLQVSNEHIVADSPCMQQILKEARKIAEADSTTIIYGESGTGKDVIARYIFEKSKRQNQVFIPINCAAIPRDLMEAEFFGYADGAFTGAKKNGQKGLFEVCDKGTLFLDEVGEIPLELQPKLLRVLESGELKRIGATTVKRTDVRIIAATNRNLQELVQNGKFREDLYYRLNVTWINLPPLRKRGRDIDTLLYIFLKEYNKKYQKNRILSPEAIQAFHNYPWPGNIREMRNVIERMVIIAPQGQILDADPYLNIISTSEQKKDQEEKFMPSLMSEFMNGTLKSAMEKFEREYLKYSLNQSGKNVTEVAKMLGIHPSGLYKKIEKYGLKKHYK